LFFILSLLTLLSNHALASDRLRLMIETDAGGDPDDEQSFVRFLLYANEWDVEGIVATRPVTRRKENKNPEPTGLAILRAQLNAPPPSLSPPTTPTTSPRPSPPSSTPRTPSSTKSAAPTASPPSPPPPAASTSRATSSATTARSAPSTPPPRLTLKRRVTP